MNEETTMDNEAMSNNNQINDGDTITTSAENNVSVDQTAVNLANSPLQNFQQPTPQQQGNNTTSTQQTTQQPVQQQPTQQQGTQPQQPTLEDKLNEDRNKWTNEITSLNEMMRTLPKVNDLLSIIYMKRQEAVDYYHSMNTVILKQLRVYKQQSLDMSNKIKLQGYNGVRIPNDSGIQKIVEANLADEKSIIDLLTNHNNFIKETISTIDNLIYGINQKIKLGEILNGLKF